MTRLRLAAAAAVGAAIPLTATAVAWAYTRAFSKEHVARSWDRRQSRPSGFLVTNRADVAQGIAGIRVDPGGTIRMSGTWFTEAAPHLHLADVDVQGCPPRYGRLPIDVALRLARSEADRWADLLKRLR